VEVGRLGIEEGEVRLHRLELQVRGRIKQRMKFLTRG
jgi:hypothetical protein